MLFPRGSWLGCSSLRVMEPSFINEVTTLQSVTEQQCTSFVFGACLAIFSYF